MFLVSYIKNICRKKYIGIFENICEKGAIQKTYLQDDCIFCKDTKKLRESTRINFLNR